MPRDDGSSSVTTRRSSRLRNQQGGSKAAAASDAESSQRQKKGRTVTLSTNNKTCSSGEENTSSAKLPTSSNSNPRRSQRIRPEELKRREKYLLHKEQELKNRSDDLNERILSFARKEDEASMMMSRIAQREAQTNLQQLEEHFMCALCYEVLAAPYSLNPGHCGHTFCALCILKWFFSRLHRACGGWHESVDCPICRCPLIITPELAPRLHITFPFVPNRVAAAVIESLVEKLVKPPLCSQARVKKEETEGSWGSQSTKDRGSGCLRKREQSEEKHPEMTSENLDVTLWGEGGLMRAEWLKKDMGTSDTREGKREMTHLLKYWCSMGSQDFIVLKQKLGV
ncbi:hypothetical protein B0H34DRAFT_673876 [Crassisporium funariophilum]|nr:hypothetical protein B0H34DRAFT_673876 [Crassisporium funariophilum]